jgi:hypothetical protein
MIRETEDNFLETIAAVEGSNWRVRVGQHFVKDDLAEVMCIAFGLTASEELG